MGSGRRIVTPPLSEPMLPDGDPCHAVHAGIEALFETACTEKLPLMERADRLHECKVGGLYGARTIGGECKALIFSSALSATSQNRGSPKWRLRRIGWSESWLYRLLRLCRLLSPDERTALKGTAIENSDEGLHAVACIRGAGKRAAMISALSDVRNPAPSLHEALHRAGLYRYADAEQTHRQTCLPARAWRRANPDALKKFASWMSAERPRVGSSIFTSVDVYLGEEGREVMTKSLPEPSTSEEKPRVFVIEGVEPSPVNLMYDPRPARPARSRQDISEDVRPLGGCAGGDTAPLSGRNACRATRRSLRFGGSDARIPVFGRRPFAHPPSEGQAVTSPLPEPVMLGASRTTPPAKSQRWVCLGCRRPRAE